MHNLPEIKEGFLTADGLQFGIAVGRFNDFITTKLLEGALDALKRHGAQAENINVVWVPGAWEIPLVAKKLANKNFDAVICLAAIVRGDTPHFEYVATEASKGIAKVALDSNIPVSNGIVTAEAIEQAVERAGTKSGNKGWDAALSAIEMANLLKEV